MSKDDNSSDGLIRTGSIVTVGDMTSISQTTKNPDGTLVNYKSVMLPTSDIGKRVALDSIVDSLANNTGTDNISASITTASTFKADMVFNNPTTGKEMVRISSDGFYVHGKKLDQPETEARELYEAMMTWCNVRI